MALKRLMGKAIKMSLRDKKQFVVFCLMYTILIFWTAYSVELSYKNTSSGIGSLSLLVAFVVSIMMSLLYAWIIVSRNRRTWATLKCIGYTNKDINKITSGNILFTTFTGFFIVIEFLFHWFAIVGYWNSFASPNTRVSEIPLIGLTYAVVSCLIFLVVQIIAIILANRKILKVRPIVALKKVGE